MENIEGLTSVQHVAGSIFSPEISGDTPAAQIYQLGQHTEKGEALVRKLGLENHREFYPALYALKGWYRLEKKQADGSIKYSYPTASSFRKAVARWQAKGSPEDAPVATAYKKIDGSLSLSAADEDAIVWWSNGKASAPAFYVKGVEALEAAWRRVRNKMDAPIGVPKTRRVHQNAAQRLLTMSVSDLQEALIDAREKRAEIEATNKELRDKLASLRDKLASLRDDAKADKKTIQARLLSICAELAK